MPVNAELPIRRYFSRSPAIGWCCYFCGGYSAVRKPGMVESGGVTVEKRPAKRPGVLFVVFGLFAAAEAT